MICIRVFRSEKEAKWAKTVLESAGILSTIKHDKFEGVPIEKYGIPPRFKLMIDRINLNHAARFLAKKSKKDKF